MREREETKAFLGRGLRFPVRTEEATGRFQMSSYEEDIRESIYIILNTRPGERLMRPEFGCRIFQYLFETPDYTAYCAMAGAVREALLLWEPRIDEIEVEADGKQTAAGTVNIHIRYVVRKTNNPYNLVYPFYLNEGLGTGERV